MMGVLIGQIVNVHGIKGEVKIYPYTDDVENLASYLKKISLGEDMASTCKISCRIQKNMLIAKIQGVNTVEDAEKLKNKNVYIFEDELNILEEDNYYIKDLIGIEVFDEKENLVGKLEYIFNTGANDVYEILTIDNNKIYLPAIKQVIKKVDIKNRKMYVKIMEGLV